MVYMYGLEKNIETSCLDDKYRAVLPRSKGEIQRRLEENISAVLLTAREEFQSPPCYHLEQSYSALLSRSAGEFQSRPATAWKRVLEPSCSGRRQTLEPSFSCSGEELQSRLAKVLRRILQYIEQSYIGLEKNFSNFLPWSGREFQSRFTDFWS